MIEIRKKNAQNIWEHIDTVNSRNIILSKAYARTLDTAFELTELNGSNNFKTAGTYELIRWFSVYMGDSNTLDNPARVLMEADSTGVTVKVNGWYCRPMQRLLK